METIGTDETKPRTMLEALAAESALRAAMSPQEHDWSGLGGNAVRRQGTALNGFKVALPFAALLWVLIAGMLWAAAR